MTALPDDDVLLVERSGAVATLTLNRPTAYNALTVDLKVALRDALAALAADPAVRCVVLTGAGRAFCSGQDLKEHVAGLRAAGGPPLSTVAEHYNPTIRSLVGMPKPVVAAVNGVAAGAGAGLAFACDFRIVSTAGSFLLAFANVGLTLDSGVSWTLPRLIGGARATAMALLAEPVGAEAALDMGLVNAVVGPERLLPAAQELATRLAAGPTAAYAAIKQSLRAGMTSSLEDTLAVEADLQLQCGATADHVSATEAFLAKQRPTFVGH